MKTTWGSILLAIGILIILTGYTKDTTICDDEYFRVGCTHNNGLLSNKTNQINIGGFIALAGVILLATNTQKSTIKKIDSEQVDKDKSSKMLFEQKQKGYARNTCPRCSYTVGVVRYSGMYWICDKCGEKIKLTD